MSTVLAQTHDHARRGISSWLVALCGTIAYPGLLFAGEWALKGHHAAFAALTILLSVAVPVLALRALLHGREARASLYVMFAVPSLFSLTYTLTRMVGIGKYVTAIWISAWIAVGLVVYFRGSDSKPVRQTMLASWLRVTHGVAALLLLLGFLLAHVVNHDLAVWSVELHGAVMTWLRLWYRSIWVEPILFGLLAVMIATGVPMVVHYARQRMDAFRIIQTATGVYVAVFVSSHLLAILLGRSRGIETDWAFAAGPASLLEGVALLNRLIPHYFFGVLCLIVHVACGLRIVLLKHGASAILANRLMYVLAGAAVLATGLSTAALLGVHLT